MHCESSVFPEADDFLCVEQCVQVIWRPADFILRLVHAEILGKRVTLDSWRKHQLWRQGQLPEQMLLYGCTADL